jgi:hypothetical protein
MKRVARAILMLCRTGVLSFVAAPSCEAAREAESLAPPGGCDGVSQDISVVLLDGASNRQVSWAAPTCASCPVPTKGAIPHVASVFCAACGARGGRGNAAPRERRGADRTDHQAAHADRHSHPAPARLQPERPPGVLRHLERTSGLARRRPHPRRWPQPRLHRHHAHDVGAHAHAGAL